MTRRPIRHPTSPAPRRINRTLQDRIHLDWQVTPGRNHDACQGGFCVDGSLFQRCIIHLRMHGFCLDHKLNRWQSWFIKRIIHTWMCDLVTYRNLYDL